jgi:sortase A
MFKSRRTLLRNLWKQALAALVLAVGAVMVGQGLFIGAKAQIAQILLERAWSRALDGESAPSPWPWADTWPVARLSAPGHDEDAIVLAEAGGEALAFGPALLAASVAPGSPGTSVIAAHRDTHFEFLKDLVPGDLIEVEGTDGDIIRFRVTHTDIVNADRSGIEPIGGPPRLALVTCWPFGGVMTGPDRYVVWADIVPEASTGDAGS